ncbi:unnamed protein product [Rotaria sordida]|uniref:Uncharacterized protein n=1 Tax=Rotaria sordida TaxID=392033 RepID=A0A814LSL4_9BILA|nr:unnamed protein product [Rotaria sordida]CAF1253330.1 unnamed protein product [Rotaria sordida]
MFDAKIDSTSISNDNNNNNRSRSLLRQIGATLTGRSCSRHPTDTTNESPSVSLLRKKHRSFDNVNIEQRSPKCYIKRTSKTKTPISFSHRLSLLNQVKTHIIGTHKHRQTISSISNDDNKYLLLPSIMSITSINN